MSTAMGEDVGGQRCAALPGLGRTLAGARVDAKMLIH